MTYIWSYLFKSIQVINSFGTAQLTKYSADLKVLAARDEMQWGEAGPPPLLVKIAPDLSKQDLADIAAVKATFTPYCLHD